MDNRLIFLYHRFRDKTERMLLRESRQGLPTRVLLGNRWRDAGR